MSLNDSADLVWYCLGVQSRRERVTAQMLRERGYKAVAPMVWSSRRIGSGGRAGKTVWFKVPAIHGYVFVALPAYKPNLDAIYRLGLVRPALEFDGLLARIGMVVFLRWIRSIGARPDQKASSTLKIGDLIEFKSDLFQQPTAVVVGVKGRKIRVRGLMFNGPTTMTVDASMVRKVESSTKFLADKNKCLTSMGKRVNRPLTMGHEPPSDSRRHPSALMPT